MLGHQLGVGVINVMAHSWHIRIRSWQFAAVCHVADLPFLFALVR